MCTSVRTILSDQHKEQNTKQKWEIEHRQQDIDEPTQTGMVE